MPANGSWDLIRRLKVKAGNLKEQATWKASVGVCSVVVYVSGIGTRGRNLFKSYFRLLFYHFLVVSCKTLTQ